MLLFEPGGGREAGDGREVAVEGGAAGEAGVERKGGDLGVGVLLQGLLDVLQDVRIHPDGLGVPKTGTAFSSSEYSCLVHILYPYKSTQKPPDRCLIFKKTILILGNEILLERSFASVGLG